MISRCWPLMVAALLSSTPSFGACVGSSRELGQTVGYDKIFIDTSSLPGSIRGYVGTAANFWNSDACNPPIAGAEYTFEFPILSVDYSQGASRNVEVIYRTGFNPSNDTSCGNFAGNTLTLYEKARRDGMPLTCLQGPLLTDTITHEFGHLLGLVDQYGSECSTYVMNQAGFTSNGTYVDRTLHSSECQKVAETNVTPAEQYFADCQANPSLCPPDNQCGYIPEDAWCHSPIVLDMAKNGFNFSGPQQPVLFDFDADSFREKTCWTGTRTDDTFLALDRNGNGVIDDGSELFGDSTPFLNGALAQNGYQVLFELDVVRGNANGYIDRGDVDWELLLLWRDSNHDGQSQPNELWRLASTDLYAISVEYFVSLMQDQFGNRLRYHSYAYRAGNKLIPPGVLSTVDVFFAPAQ